LSKPVESPEELRRILDFMAQSEIARKRAQSDTENPDFSPPIRVDYDNLVDRVVASAFRRSNFVPVVVEGVGIQYAVTKKLECY